MKTYIKVLIVLVLLVVGYVYYSKQYLNTNDVESVAFARVDEKTAGVWDKKVEVIQTNTSEDAVIGTWWAHDRWNWIGWKGTQGWNVLVSLDGFDCKELKTIPKQLEGFFADVTHTPSGSEYCYDHTVK